jgi:hypothetical protein
MLPAAEIAAFLRSLPAACSPSFSARITPTTFVNDYSWGNFKGDEDAHRSDPIARRLADAHGALSLP